MVHPILKHLSWEVIFKNAEKHISEVDKRAEVIEALSILKSKLGEEFLKRALELEIAFLFNFTFDLVWHSGAVVNLSNQLKMLDGEENFQKLISTFKKLPQKERFFEILTLLDTGYFFKNSFQINFSPKIAGFSKRPDIGIKNNVFKEEILIEVSEMRSSQEKENINEVMSLFNPYFHDIRFQTFGNLKRLTSNDIIKEALNEFDSKLLTEIANNGICHFKKDNWLELISFAPNFRDQAEAIAKTSGIEINGFSGPFIEKSEWVRLRHKISEEQSQLPAGRTNLIFIWANDLIFEVNYYSRPLSEFLEAELVKYHHISGIILLGVFPNFSFDVKTSSDVEIFTNKNGLIYYVYSKFRIEHSELGNQIMDAVKVQIS